MTEEIINEYGYIDDELKEKLKRLEQENKVLTRENENRNDWITSLNKKCEELIKEKLNYRSALEEIREIADKYKDMEGCRIPLGVIKMTIDEVLNKG